MTNTLARFDPQSWLVPGTRCSDVLDVDALGVRGQGVQVVLVAGEDGSVRFGQGDEGGIHNRTSTSPAAKVGGPTSAAPRERRPYEASLQEPVGVDVPSRSGWKALDQDDGRDDRRPEPGGSQAPAECQRSLRAIGQEAHGTAVEEQQGSTRSVELSIPDP